MSFGGWMSSGGGPDAACVLGRSRACREFRAQRAAGRIERAAYRNRSHLGVLETGTRMAMTAPQAGRIYSQWDKVHQRCGSRYGHMMADAVYHGMPTNTSARVLMLGLGGGVIGADMLCRDARGHGGARIRQLVAIELEPQVVSLAMERFFPVMFSGVCAGARERMRVVVGDALAAASLVRQRPSFHAIAVDVPPVYDAPETAPDVFWRSLGSLTAPGALLVANTIYTRPHDARTLQARLERAGWAPLPSIIAGPGSWRPRANVLVLARRAAGAARDHYATFTPRRGSH